MDEHLKTCDYVKLPCPNECTCKGRGVFEKATQLFRKDLQKHLEDRCPRRQYSCPHCQKNGKYKHITGDHTEDCPKMIIECSNAFHCKTTFPRENERAHLSTCQYQNVACKYSEFGCKKRPFRKDLQEHENDDNAHLRIAMPTMLMTTMLTLKKQCMLNTQLHCSNMKDQLGLIEIFKMPSFKEKKRKQ